MSDRYRTVLLFGAPGVGKGTQGRILGCVPGMRHMATGDIFRALDPASPLGRKFHEYSSRGELVPDDVTVQIWRDHTQKLIKEGKFSPDRDLLVLDGIPRSPAQADAMSSHIEVLRIVHLTTPDLDSMAGRMKLRAVREGRRDDSNEAVIRRRFEVYMSETRPVLQRYDAKLVCEVNGIGTPAEVLVQVLQAIIPLYNAHYGNPLGA